VSLKTTMQHMDKADKDFNLNIEEGARSEMHEEEEEEKQ
jgi:hypothetical protein